MRAAVVLSAGILIVACAGHAKQAVVMYESGDYAGAARYADEFLSSYPKDEGLWQMRVRAALALGNADDVARSYASYRSIRSDDDNELLRDLAIATIGQALASPSVRLKIAAIQARRRRDPASPIKWPSGSAITTIASRPLLPSPCYAVIRRHRRSRARCCARRIPRRAGSPSTASARRSARSP
jgi:hypothetical protein